MCAVVAEVACRFVAQVMSATDCGTTGEMAAETATLMKAGMLGR